MLRIRHIDVVQWRYHQRDMNDECMKRNSRLMKESLVASIQIELMMSVHFLPIEWSFCGDFIYLFVAVSLLGRCCRITIGKINHSIQTSQRNEWFASTYFHNYWLQKLERLGNIFRDSTEWDRPSDTCGPSVSLCGWLFSFSFPSAILFFFFFRKLFRYSLLFPLALFRQINFNSKQTSVGSN